MTFIFILSCGINNSEGYLEKDTFLGGVCDVESGSLPFTRVLAILRGG